MKKGLVSITFRQKSPEEVIELVKSAGLTAIEWGGDVQVPHGDIEIAKRVGELTRESGIDVVSYGSYYNYHAYYYDHSKDSTFEGTLNSAIALGTKIIRVWAGIKNFDETTEEERKPIYDNLKYAVEKADKHGITIATEFHPNTLTNTPEGAEETLANVPGLKTYWQPLYDRSLETECEIIKKFGKDIVNAHLPGRATLAAIKDRIGVYIEHLEKYTNSHSLLIEFVKDGNVEQFFEDAKIFTNI